MDLTFTESELAFRDEVRAWLEANVPRPALPSMDTAEGFDLHRQWEHRLHADRWSVVSWPRAYGGREAGLMEWLIFEEEYYRAGAPGRVSQNGIFLLAPTLFEFGTREQKDRFLPTMASGEEIWGQGWSEPNAGSDLASLTSKAHRVAGGWRLTGQKTWCSRGAFCDWMFGLFRTDPEAGRHRGLTYFLVDLRSEGVHVNPVGRLDGDPGFGEIFLEEVFVPDDLVLGGVNQGWSVAMATTSSERGLTLRSPGRFMAAADRLVSLYKRLGDPTDTAMRDRVTQCWIDADAYRTYTFATVSRVVAGGSIGAESSLNKIFWSEMDVRIHECALDLLQSRAELDDDARLAEEHGRWLEGYLFSLSGPIYAGTNEIQRNIAAERVLGLPR